MDNPIAKEEYRIACACSKDHDRLVYTLVTRKDELVDMGYEPISLGGATAGEIGCICILFKRKCEKGIHDPLIRFLMKRER